MTLDELFEYTNIDPWFLNQLAELHQAEQWLKSQALTDISRDDFLQAKKRGFSDLQISRLTGMHFPPARLRIVCFRIEDIRVDKADGHGPLRKSALLWEIFWSLQRVVKAVLKPPLRQHLYHIFH